MEYIRKHAVRLLRLREQHTPPRSVVVIVVSLQLMHQSQPNSLILLLIEVH